MRAVSGYVVTCLLANFDMNAPSVTWIDGKPIAAEDINKGATFWPLAMSVSVVQKVLHGLSDCTVVVLHRYGTCLVVACVTSMSEWTRSLPTALATARLQRAPRCTSAVVERVLHE